MSRDFDNNMKKIIDTNKELHKESDKSLKEISDIKRLIKTLESKLSGLEEKIDTIYEILNNFSVLMYEEEDLDDEEDFENKDWTPYDDENWEDNGGDDSYYPENFSDN